MKEKPILFSGEMVRAILEGRKTMTRRVVKGEALNWLDNAGFTPVFVADPENYLCPYGIPGQRLYVRETFLDDGETKERPQWIYRADNENYPRHEGQNWKPSIFMPRAASRILLEITDVRVERLQEINEADARAEGVEPDVDAGYWKGYIFPGVYDSAKKSFASLWQSINGLGSWDQNPWVWVVSFKRIEQ